MGEPHDIAPRGSWHLSCVSICVPEGRSQEQVNRLRVTNARRPHVPASQRIPNQHRRKWATERKGHPVKDVAAAGGWRTEEVLTTSYQQADAETIKNVVLHPTHRIVSR